MSDLTDLAKQTLAMLDKQQEYFKCNERQEPERKGRLLAESKRMERDLRKRCETLLNPDTPLSLFGGVAESPNDPSSSSRVLVPAGGGGGEDEDTDPSAPWWTH